MSQGLTVSDENALPIHQSADGQRIKSLERSLRLIEEEHQHSLERKVEVCANQRFIHIVFPSNAHTPSLSSLAARAHRRE